MALVLLAACSEGNSCDESPTDPSCGPENPVQAAYQLALSATSARPGDSLFATITLSDNSTVNLNQLSIVADYGAGIMAPVSFADRGNGRVRLFAPLGSLDPQTFAPTDGALTLRVQSTATTNAPAASAAVSLTIGGLAVPSAPPGDITLSYLAASRILVLRSIGNVTSLEAKVPTLDPARVSAVVQRQNAELDAIEAFMEAIVRVQNGETVTLSKPGATPVLRIGPAMLGTLDRSAVALFGVPPRPRAALGSARASHGLAGASAAVIQLDIEELFDVQGLANELAQYGRTVATRVRSVSTTALSVVAAGALLAGAPAVAAGAAGLAAISWLATTGVAVGTGIALEAGTSAVLNGKASLEDLKPSAVYAWDAYMEQAQGYVQGKVLDDAFGPTWGTVVDAGINVYGTVQEFIDQDVEQAFDEGAIPQAGYPASNFVLAVTPQYGGGGTYTVTVTTSPATDGATIRLQVSGTDGYRASSDQATAGGVATFSFPAGQPGVRDAINAVHVEGRAAGSATLTF